jgi:hypothetical protein
VSKIKGLDRSTTASAPPAEEAVLPSIGAVQPQPTATDPAWLPMSQELRAKDPPVHWSTIALRIDQAGLGSPSGAEVKAAVTRAQESLTP